ncbi:MAG TPA: cell wall-binding repeat-containing protein [Desulfosporosinus sp.]|nr:cell wall-binding repeat-containing protein [Desulfosporosinus sp.]
MHNPKHKKPSQWLRFLVLALIFALLCPAGVLAQDSLTVAVQTAGNQVTLQGTTTPESVVTLMVTKSLNGDKSYIDQLSSTSQGTYQTIFQLANGDYKVKVSSNGIQQEKSFTVGQQTSLLTPPLLSADSTDNTLGKAVDLTFTDNSAWRNAISSITVDGTVLPPSQYTITAGNLRLLAGVMTTAGSHTIAIIATGYNNATVSQNLESAPTNLGTVKVRVVDNVQRRASEVASLGANYRQPFGEILPPTDVAITEGLTMRGALEKALATKNMNAYGAANYVSGIGPVTSADGRRTVTKLSEFDSGMQSGWMVTLNDWFINAGVNSFVVKDGDVVEFCYTCNLGVDVDGDVNNTNTTLKALSSSAGTLSPTFTPATKNYTLTLPAATKIIVTPTAANRTNQVTIKSGNETYRRTDEIAVVNKQVITVTCAENIYKITIAIAGDNSDQGRADEVSTLVAALPAVDKITLKDKTQIEAARAAYAALSGAQKALVTNLAKLTAAEAALAKLVGEDKTPPVITVKDMANQTLNAALTVTKASFSFQVTAQDATDGPLSPSVRLINTTMPEGQSVAPGAGGSYTVTLAKGPNTLTVRAVDAAGNSAEQSYTVTYTPGSDSPGTIGQVREASGKVTQYFNTSGYTSDWVIVGKGVAGQTIAPTYLNDIVQTVDEYYEKLNSGQMAKVTDLEKWVLSILAAGGNPRDVNGHDLVETVYNFYVSSSNRDITFQGINGVIFGLIALDAKDYVVPENARYSRNYLISYLLTHQNSDGGWDLGTTGSSDVDITSMTLQALAPYYTRAEVKTAANKAVNWLSGEQSSDGGFTSTGTVNSEAISQAVIGLSANGIDPTAEDFTKSGKNLLDALFAFQQADGSFRHTLSDESSDDMATEQAYLALLAYDRFVQAGEKYNNGKSSVYYFGNTETGDTVAPVITTDLMSKTVNTADYAFTATAMDAVEGAVSVQVKFNGDSVAPATDGSYTVTLREGASNIITLEAKDSKNNTASASYTLIYKPGVILVTLIELPTSAEVKVGETVSLSATVTPSTATDQTLKWSSSNAAVATVDDNGKVAGEKEGTVTITAEANDGSGMSAACTVVVSASGGGGTPTDPMITVSFTLKGDSVHGTVAKHTAFQTWIPKTSVSVAKKSTVYDVFTKVLDDKGIQYEETQDNYIGRIKAPASFGGDWLGEFDNGPNSGWMYTVNGKHPSLGLREYKLKDDDVVVWHYTDDYTKEEDSDMDDDDNSGSSGGSSGSSSGTSPGTPAAPVSTIPGALGESNQNALAVLNSVTPEQQAGAALPEDTPRLNPTALTATVLTAADGVQLSVPAGALNNQSDPIKFTVRIGQITTPPQADSGIMVLDPLKYQRQFEMENAAGLVQEDTANFTAPVTLTFPITGDLPTGITTGQLAIYWWNLDKKDWVKLGGVFDPLTNTLSVPTYHFSTYAVMADTSSVPKRLAGVDRFLTANEVAAQGWKAGADNAVLVNANTFSDALAAAPLAFKLNAPILLTERDTLTPSTQEELQKLGVKKVTLIGGTGVISQAIETELQNVYGTDNIQRYGGVDRYETAALLAAALGTTGQAVLANGEDGHYSDALAISAYAAYNGIPILFTEAQALPAATAQALKDQKVSSTIVVGGEVVVAALVYNQLPGAVRYAGMDSYATAIAIAEGLKLNPNRIYIATGLNFADALTAGNLAAHTLSPLIMVDQTVPQASADYLTKQHEAISDLVIIGGEGIINAEQESALRMIIQ